KGTLSRSRKENVGSEATDDEGTPLYYDNEMTRGRKKYPKIRSTRRTVLTMGLTLVSVVA
ncbi:hypothetical protein BGZ76_006713, partial [Entomortierella beljakovae]